MYFVYELMYYYADDAPTYPPVFSEWRVWVIYYVDGAWFFW